MRRTLIRIDIIVMAALAALTVGCLSAIAQATNAPPTFPPPGGEPDPLLSLPALITAAVPILVALIKKWVPTLPKMALPVIAPAAGALLGYLLTKTTGEGSTLLGAFLGLAGTGLREIIDQARQRLSAPATPPTS